MGLYIVVHMSLVVISMFLRALNMSNFINILMTLLFAETFAYSISYVFAKFWSNANSAYYTEYSAFSGAISLFSLIMISIVAFI